MSLDVRVERARCIGSRTCVSRAPAVFALDDTGVAVVLDPDGAAPDDVMLAAEGCPTRAISVERDGGP